MAQRFPATRLSVDQAAAIIREAGNHFELEAQLTALNAHTYMPHEWKYLVSLIEAKRRYFTSLTSAYLAYVTDLRLTGHKLPHPHPDPEG